MSWSEISRNISQEITHIFELMAIGPLPEQLLTPTDDPLPDEIVIDDSQVLH